MIQPQFHEGGEQEPKASEKDRMKAQMCVGALTPHRVASEDILEGFGWSYHGYRPLCSFCVPLTGPVVYPKALEMAKWPSEVGWDAGNGTPALAIVAVVVGSFDYQKPLDVLYA